MAEMDKNVMNKRIRRQQSFIRKEKEISKSDSIGLFRCDECQR